MAKECQETTENNPKNIHEKAKTSIRCFGIDNLRAKRPQTEQAKLKNLQGKRNANNRTSQSQAASEITYSRFQPTKQKPQQIT